MTFRKSLGKALNWIEIESETVVKLKEIYLVDKMFL